MPEEFRQKEWNHCPLFTAEVLDLVWDKKKNCFGKFWERNVSRNDRTAELPMSWMETAWSWLLVVQSQIWVWKCWCLAVRWRAWTLIRSSTSMCLCTSCETRCPPATLCLPLPALGFLRPKIINVFVIFASAPLSSTELRVGRWHDGWWRWRVDPGCCQGHCCSLQLLLSVVALI